MVAGHLQIKNNYYYMVLNLHGPTGKRKSKWIPTGIQVGGKKNEKAAQDMLLETRYTYRDISEMDNGSALMRIGSDILFADYMQMWLRLIKNSVEEDTYVGYELTVERRIAPYFRELEVTLSSLTALHIEGFYEHCYNKLKVKGVTVQHYHGLMHKALKYAVRHDLITSSPMDKVDRPKAQKYVGSFYSLAELELLFEAAKGDPIEFPILMAAFYGLRRSEILGIQWRAVDLETNILTIDHTIIQVKCDGQMRIFEKDRTKNMSSCRSLPIVPEYRDLLLRIKEQQEENRKICGNCYIESDYVCVNPMGELYTPNYVSAHFKLLLKKNGLRPIRFHDLRHTCASLLLKNGATMRSIQDWLGHSHYSTTAEIYAHLETGAKETTANKLAGVISIAPSQ